MFFSLFFTIYFTWIFYGVPFIKKNVFVALDTLIFFRPQQSGQCPERVFFIQFDSGKVPAKFSGSYRS